MTCSYEGCDEPVHAAGKCARHYSRDYKRLRSGTGVTGAGRRPMDKEVFKLRYQLPDGAGSNTKHYSDREVAERLAQKHRAEGTLLFYARFTLAETMDVT